MLRFGIVTQLVGSILHDWMVDLAYIGAHETGDIYFERQSSILSPQQALATKQLWQLE